MTGLRSRPVIPTKVGIHEVLNAVIPTKVGIHAVLNAVIPACAGMTEPEHPHGR